MLRLLKIGGSVITDKKRPYTALHDVINNIARAISRAYGNRFMIGHGGGSFPHVSAKKYRTAEGVKSRRGLYGVGVVHYDATWINQIFMRALHRAGVPAMSFHPNSFILAEGGRPVAVFLRPLFEALRRGIVPVFYGDVVMDRRRGVSIFSTEMIIAAIATQVGERVIVGMAEKYGGVYTADPARDPEAQLIREVTPQNVDEVLRVVGGSEGIDVTGGMAHKVRELLALAEQGIPSVIFKGTPDNIERFLKGEPVEGTYFHA